MHTKRISKLRDKDLDTIALCVGQIRMCSAPSSHHTSRAQALFQPVEALRPRIGAKEVRPSQHAVAVPLVFVEPGGWERGLRRIRGPRHYQVVVHVSGYLIAWGFVRRQRFALEPEQDLVDFGCMGRRGVYDLYKISKTK